MDPAGPAASLGRVLRTRPQVLGNRCAIPTGSTALLISLLIPKKVSRILPLPEWPVFNRSLVAAFGCSVTFEPEWVIIADCEADPSANLELRVAKENVWFANMVPMPTVGHRAVGGWSDSPVPIEIEVRQASLSSDTCLALRDLWSIVLKRRIHWAGGGVDGTEYVFFAGTGVNESCGETWSPRDGTFLHRLVEVVDDLNHLALDEDLLSRRKRDAQLRERAMRLTEDQLTRERKTK